MQTATFSMVVMLEPYASHSVTRVNGNDEKMALTMTLMMLLLIMVFSMIMMTMIIIVMIIVIML